MKLIDLLNDIANGNTLPDKILVFDDIFTLDKDAKDYKIRIVKKEASGTTQSAVFNADEAGTSST